MYNWNNNNNNNKQERGCLKLPGVALTLMISHLP